MAKNLKINFKNTQLAEALNLKKIKKTVKKTVKKITVEKEEPPKKKKARVLSSAEIESSKKAATIAAEEKTEKVSKKKTSSAKKEPLTEVQKEEKQEATAAPVIPETTSTSIDVAAATIAAAKAPKKPIAETSTTTTPATTDKTTIAKEEKSDSSTKQKKPVFSESKKALPRKELKPKKQGTYKAFDSRDRMGLRASEEERWRKRRPLKHSRYTVEEPPDRPKTLTVRLPITIKDLATSMKFKSSELISKLFLQGLVITLNDFLTDETTVQLLGHEFGCEITIDRSEEERLQITSQSIKEEISATDPKTLQIRPPIITFMGHVDHGKTSLIDAIRKSNITASEAGAITQHIGAFSAKTSFGSITILDTPGHEAFSEMRERGANATDIVVLVIAGDEGVREQTIEALTQAQAAEVPVVVAINKSDKDGYDPEKIYRQMSDHKLLPEAWGGTTITVNCSATTKEGINQLLELLSLQAEILELKADPLARARGAILESQMHKGLGPVATVLIQNGTLKLNDSIVFGNQYGRIKTMHDQFNKSISTAPPSTPVKITGLSGLAEAGLEFIVVPSEKEAKKLAHDREEEFSRDRLAKSQKASLESVFKKQESKKILPLILKADVQGSLEALIAALKKLPMEKVSLNIIKAEVGEISESDVMLASASNAPIVGFHTKIEGHAAELISELGIKVYLHNIIYHAIDEITKLMIKQLDKIAVENDTGKAEIKALFKSSHLGTIAGCQIIDGIIKRGQMARVVREEEVIFKSKIASVKRVKEDVKEATKGQECGILIENFDAFQEQDIIQTYDITYLEPEL